jgi:hypothetical protein
MQDRDFPGVRVARDSSDQVSTGAQVMLCADLTARPMFDPVQNSVHPFQRAPYEFMNMKSDLSACSCLTGKSMRPSSAEAVL